MKTRAPARRNSSKRSSDPLEDHHSHDHAPVEQFAPIPAGLAVAEPADGPLQRLHHGEDPLGGTAIPESTTQVLRRRRGAGSALPAPVAGMMSERMGADFSGVRIHNDPEAHQVTESVQAHAFTQGRDIYFGKGNYQPSSPAGQHMLAHELAHVVQGGGGGAGTIGRADDPAEAEADRMADGAMRRSTSPHPGAESGTSTGPPAIRRLPKVLKNLKARLTKKKKTAGTAPTGGATTAPMKPAVQGPVTSGEKPKVAKAIQLAADRTGSTPTVVATALAPTTQSTVQAPQDAPVTKVEPLPEKPDTADLQDVAGESEAATSKPEALGDEGPEATDPVPTTVPVTEPTSAPVSKTPDVATSEATPDVATPDVASPDTTGKDTVTTTPKTVSAPVTATVDPEIATPVVTAPVVKPAKETFKEALAPATAPGSPAEGNTRMAQLRILLGTMSKADRTAISEDRELLTAAKVHLGGIGYMTLLGALDMNKKKKKKSTGKEVKHHLTGAEADSFILANIPRYPHLVPFIDSALSAGKKGEGFIATVNQEDWDALYTTQFTSTDSSDAVGGKLEKSTNAYVGNKSPDEPAVLHQDRGTPSTAIHESMHRYSDMKGVLVKWGFNLNEGMTEYFTRLLTNQNAEPSTSGPERDNYPKQIEFVRSMIRVLGSNVTEQQTALAQIYFSGNLDVFKTKFVAAWKVKDSKLSERKLNAKWDTFSAKMKASDWTAALAEMPAP